MVKPGFLSFIIEVLCDLHSLQHPLQQFFFTHPLCPTVYSSHTVYPLHQACAHEINKNDVSVSYCRITRFSNLSVQSSAAPGWALQAVLLQAAFVEDLLLLSAGVWAGRSGSAPHVLVLG